MSPKRAFIVDDSRSARVILSRMLESYGMQVDTAESAEHALEYLKQSRPDVIFMDHLMPGMDGFQAIQAIKSNPETSVIPVVMYTSQEGELYISQARALGAVGVLPKTVKQADVSRVLYQLHLLPERREGKSQLIARAAEESAVVQQDSGPGSSLGELEAAVRRAITAALKEHSSELRRFYLASFEAFARRLGGEIKGAAGAAPPPAPPEAQAAEIPSEPAPQSQPARWPWVAAIAVLALIPAALLAFMYLRSMDEMRMLNQNYAQLAAALEAQQTRLGALQKTLQELPQPAALLASPDVPAGSEPEIVPYGEVPLSGARVERLRDIVEELRARNFHGVVHVKTFTGDFCLTGNATEGYSLAAEDLPAKRCDLIGNPYDDGLNPAQRQSLAFANLVSSVRQQAGASLDIQIAHAGRSPLAASTQNERLTKLSAGEWNRLAAQNNRVEFSVEGTAARMN